MTPKVPWMEVSDKTRSHHGWARGVQCGCFVFLQMGFLVRVLENRRFTVGKGGTAYANVLI